jgi:hypothetical protein
LKNLMQRRVFTPAAFLFVLVQINSPRPCNQRGRAIAQQKYFLGAVMDDLKAKYLDQIANAADEAVLEDIRLAAVGKKGEVALKMRELGKMTPEERQAAGPALNALKDEINSALIAKKSGLADAALDARLRTEWLDVTLPARDARVGTLHPISQVQEEVTAIFAEMGFAVAEGPRIDTDWYNFDAHVPRANPFDGKDRRADTDHLPRWCVPCRLRSHAHADVPSGRRACDRQRHLDGEPEMGA